MAEYKVQKYEIKNEFKICPVCGYKNGLHSMFKKEESGSIKWLFICPNCSSVFDLGLSVKQ